MPVAVGTARLTDRRVLAALRLVVLAVVVLQRFAVPGVGTALCLPVVLAVAGYLGLGGALAEDEVAIGTLAIRQAPIIEPQK